MKQTEDLVNPYVRLSADADQNYTLEVMLPISASAEVSVDDGTFEPDATLGLPEFVNYQVRLTSQASINTSEYKLVTVPLNHEAGTNGIVVYYFRDHCLDGKGPEVNGRTIIQFEDAVR